MTTEETIDTANYGLVGKRRDKVVLLRPLQELTNAQALNVAAYLVLMADDWDGSEFAKVLKAVSNT